MWHNNYKGLISCWSCSWRQSKFISEISNSIRHLCLDSWISPLIPLREEDELLSKGMIHLHTHWHLVPLESIWSFKTSVQSRYDTRHIGDLLLYWSSCPRLRQGDTCSATDSSVCTAKSHPKRLFVKRAVGDPLQCWFMLSQVNRTNDFSSFQEMSSPSPPTKFSRSQTLPFLQMCNCKDPQASQNRHMHSMVPGLVLHET